MKTSNCTCIFILFRNKKYSIICICKLHLWIYMFYLLLLIFTGTKMASVKVKSIFNKTINIASFNHLFSIIYTTRINWLIYNIVKGNDELLVSGQILFLELSMQSYYTFCISNCIIVICRKTKLKSFNNSKNNSIMPIILFILWMTFSLHCCLITQQHSPL